MQLLDLTLPTPAENLACDEVLLDLCEENRADEVLRFWEAPAPFAVLGYSNKAAAEVNLESCRRDGLPVLRRVTGGGAVLQGPGCLNYALVLRIPETGPLAQITGTNQFIMEQHRQALTPVVGAGIAAVCVQGHSDLTLGDLKFSGNAQRRKRRALLFHGTFLFDFDIERVEHLLPMPTREPSYRQHRTHRDFLVNAGAARAAIKDAITRCWNATPAGTIPLESVSTLAQSRYASDEWTFKFGSSAL